MEEPLECGDVSPDSQDHAADGKRFAVCSFRNTREEEEPAHQIQAVDPRPSRPTVGATQGIGLQGDFLSKEPQSLADLRAADGSGGYQRSILGAPPAQSEEPTFSEMKNLLCPGPSHLNLTQGENDCQGGGLLGDPDPGRALPAGFSPLSESSSKLLEAGKEDWEMWGANGAIWRWVLRVGEVSDPTQPEALVHGGWVSLGIWPNSNTSHFSSQDPSGSSVPTPADCLLAQDLTWELLASGMATLPGTLEGLR